MKKSRDSDPDMPDEVDFRGGVRGKYAARYAQGTNIVKLAPDVAQLFPTEESVNNALRALGEIVSQMPAQKPKRRSRAKASA